MRLLLYGSRDFAQTVIELVRACDHEPIGFLDDTHRGPGILGSLESVIRSHPPRDCGIVLAIGYRDLPSRWEAWQRVRSVGYETPPLIHPRAYVAESAHVGSGCIVMAGAIVDVRARIEEASVLWPGACVSHDATVGANCFVSPNATLCGYVQLGSSSFVGAGAAIADRSQVPPSTFIKMLTPYSLHSS